MPKCEVWSHHSLRSPVRTLLEYDPHQFQATECLYYMEWQAFFVLFSNWRYVHRHTISVYHINKRDSACFSNFSTVCTYMVDFTTLYYWLSFIYGEITFELQHGRDFPREQKVIYPYESSEHRLKTMWGAWFSKELYLSWTRINFLTAVSKLHEISSALSLWSKEIMCH